MKNNRIRNSDRFFSYKARASQLLYPSSTSRNQIKVGQLSNRQYTQSKNDNMLQNMKIKFLLNNLVKKLRYLTPPYSVPSSVIQQWQSNQNQQKQIPQKKNQYTKQTLSQQLSHRFQFFRHLNLLEGLLIVLFCYIITVSIVFRQNIGFQFFIIMLILSVARIFFLTFFGLLEKDNYNSSFLLDVFDDFASPVLLVITSILFLIRCSYNTGYGTYMIQIIGVFTIAFQYKQLQINFRNIVKYAQQNRMKKQLRIIQLFMLIITLAHFFGLMLYAITYICPDGKSTWIVKAGLQDQIWYIKYTYCLYWAITTMVTVGYGDLTPQNHIEVIFVMVVQLIGTAVFGYMINVIGITVDQIKKKNQQFDNYQETIDKLRDHYQLSRELCHKMKYDIKQKQNQFKNIPLKTSQEKAFLDYIQPNLKQEFVLETNMKVIKKSIFFLTHFTVNFQNQIALKLIRIIYKPDEQIPICSFSGQKNQDIQRLMVIINNGCVEIFIQKNHNNISIMKKLRQIKPSDDSLAMNVFGYSSLIMNRNVKLIAITKQTAVSYVLRRKDVLECIQKSMLDFESFNQIRQKMNLYKFLQDVEAPSLRQNQWHFIPNIFMIQKKITYENQPRLSYLRHNNRTKLKIITVRNYQNKTIPKIEDERNSLERQMTIQEDFISIESFSTKHLEDHVLHTNENDSFMGKLRIDQCKIFENFMKPFNLTNVAAAYEKSCQKKSYRKRMRTSLMSKPGVFLSKMLQKNKLKSSSLKKEREKALFL